MLERDFQTKFNKWCQNKWKGTAVFELKVGNVAIPFDAVKEHQENALFNAKHGRIVFKIPDLGNQNPFDSFQMERVGAFVVLLYNGMKHGQGTKEFFLIDIDVWLEEKKNSIRKSLSHQRAREIGMPRSLGNMPGLGSRRIWGENLKKEKPPEGGVPDQSEGREN